MLPNLALLEQIPQQILRVSNRQGEYKRPAHYGLFLLCYEAGLRVSEAINFDLSAKTSKGLYRITKTKGKKERFVYVSPKIIKELKKHDWKPNSTNRFNFYHFLKKIKRELGISQNIELTPHTLRRAFTTYHAENGLPLPLLQKLLGHSSIRTTALYWMNIYNEDDDDGVADILTAKNWPKNPKKPKLESEVPVNLNLGELPELSAPNLLTSEPHLDYLVKIKHLENKLSQIQQEKDKKIAKLESELERSAKQKETLQNNLADLSEQSTILCQEKAHETTEKEQVQQELTQAKETITQLAQELANEREQRTTAENNLLTEKKNNQTLQETNANLTQKSSNQEQNHTNLINAYQQALKDKENTQKQLNQLTAEIKTFAKSIYKWQKANYCQQLEKNELQAQIVQPPPWKPYK